MEKTKKKILLIEDEQDIVVTMEYMLKEKGYEVCAAYDGEEGLRKAIQCRPDLIILDLKLPKLPGEEVCRRIRKREDAAANTPIIMVTAKDLDVDRVIGRVIGANYYITKPFEMDNLLNKIKSLLGEE